MQQRRPNAAKNTTTKILGGRSNLVGEDLRQPGSGGGREPGKKASGDVSQSA